jgi:hypothetical protein
VPRTPRRPTRRESFRAFAPEHDEIARRAYELFLARGASHGRDLDDWLEAESQLLAERVLHRPNRLD